MLCTLLALQQLYRPEACFSLMPHACRVTIPELNPEMDVYRIGTLLEMVREIAYVVALDGKKVKVCVQQALGEGVFQVKLESFILFFKKNFLPAKDCCSWAVNRAE